MASKHIALLLLTITGALGLPITSLAQDEKAPVTVSDLDAILQEEILLKAMANRAKQRAELGKFKSEAQTSDLSNPSLPQLAWRRPTVSGWLAKLYLGDGSSLIASEGDVLPGGYFVEQINEHGVKVKRNDQVIDLAAATTESRSKSSNSQENSAPAHAAPPFASYPQGKFQ